MTKDDAINEQIDEIMDGFNFSDVARWMQTDSWTWAQEGMSQQVPDEFMLRREARRLLRLVSNSESRLVSTGGFTAERVDGIDGDGVPWIRLSLHFGYQTYNDGTSYTD